MSLAKHLLVTFVTVVVVLFIVQRITFIKNFVYGTTTTA